MNNQDKKPKHVLRKYIGVLETYYETGMECMGTIFHDDRGLHEGLHWDTKNKPNEKFMYHSLAWSIWFGKPGALYNAKIYNKKNQLVYEGPLKKDKRKMAETKYRYSYLPKDISTKRWLTFCRKNYRMELWTNEVTDAQKTEYNLQFDIGEIVYDDLTSKDLVIINISLGEGPGKTVGYWLADDYLEGGRHPWEITKINWKERWKKEQEKNGNQNG